MTSDMKMSLHWHQHDGYRVIHSSNTLRLCVCWLGNECNCVVFFVSKACFRERLEMVKVQRVTSEASPIRSTLSFPLPGFWSFVAPWPYRVWCFYLHVPLVIVAKPHRHWWGSSGAGFFFRVSMMDCMPRFTLEVTRRVTDSEEDGEEQVEDFWEEEWETRHFW